MIVVGAGMAGLLAAAMLRTECSKIYEKQSQLPNNHSAVLRFRSRTVADVLNIMFEEVTVMKEVQPWRGTIADALAYSYKCTGHSTMRSIVTADSSMEVRYIAPHDLIQRMADISRSRLHLGATVGATELCKSYQEEPIISTLPMPVLMGILGYGSADNWFRSVSGRNVVCEVEDMSAYFSLYIPDPGFDASRVSITGNQMIIECPDPHKVKGHGRGDGPAIDHVDEKLLQMVCQWLGMNPSRISNARVHQQRYAKILPIDEKIRKDFILWASQHHNIYSLGRFATWRPGLLLDDIVNDVRVICRLAGGESPYDQRKAAT